jgi:Concanavalin A-like lectin/glucanases superfamily
LRCFRRSNGGNWLAGAEFVPVLLGFVDASARFIQRDQPLSGVNTSETVLNEFIAAKRQVNAPFKGYAIFIRTGQQPVCEDMNVTPPGAGVLTFFVDGSDTGNCPRDHAVVVRGVTALNDGQWHHVAETYDGSGVASGVTLYVDGALDGMLTQRDNLGSNSILHNEDFTIGAGTGNGPQPFRGLIDELEVFNRLSGSGEVAAPSAADCHRSEARQDEPVG